MSIGLAASIGSVAGAVDELVPLLNSSADTQRHRGLRSLSCSMPPGLNAKVTKAVALWDRWPRPIRKRRLCSTKVLQAVANITLAIERLAKIANLLGDAAIPLKERLAVCRS